jgi:hypothetical protein
MFRLKMNDTLKTFIEEIKIFSKNNWWIYIIFFICLGLIYKTESWNIFEITLVFLCHFTWDLFVMMMVHFFGIKDNKKWLIFQVGNFAIFFFIWLYAWLTSWKWVYMVSNLSFILWSIKGYFTLFRGKNLDFINWYFLILVNILVFFINYELWLLNHLSTIVQVFWFAFFSTGLILVNQKIKYLTSAFWVFLIAFWSFISVYFSFLVSDIKWVDISYALLPLTVFVFYVKNYKKFMY